MPFGEGRYTLMNATAELEDIISMFYSRQDRAWQKYANCTGVDPDLFFPERGASTKEAKSVCRACMVREECLEYAIAHAEKFGIWGGLSERERRRVRRSRQLALKTSLQAG
jgi:WhiB family redox-sensing transcriptional regulator